MPFVGRHLAACLTRQGCQRFAERPTYRRLAAFDLGGANNLGHCEVVEGGNDAESQHVGQDISHGLLLEKGAPSDIAATAQENQWKNHLAEGQQDDAANADEADLLDHGLTFVSHLVPLDSGHTKRDEG